MSNNTKVLYDHRKIKNKDIYVVVEHHQVLAAWSEIRGHIENAPYLLTIDHHLDTDEAFRKYVNLVAMENESIDENAMTQDLISAIDWKDQQSIASAIANLKHDEHIHAATKSEIISASFSIQLSDHEGYEDPENSIYVVPFKCAINCQKEIIDDECVIHHALEIIEGSYLNDQLRRIGEITQRFGMEDIGNYPYILDIDLDAFHSIRAAKPTDASTFYRIIQGALAITIATEPEWVKEVWEDEQNEPSAELLLEIILTHIDTALSS